MGSPGQGEIATHVGRFRSGYKSVMGQCRNLINQLDNGSMPTGAIHQLKHERKQLEMVISTLATPKPPSTKQKSRDLDIDLTHWGEK